MGVGVLEEDLCTHSMGGCECLADWQWRAGTEGGVVLGPTS